MQLPVDEPAQQEIQENSFTPPPPTNTTITCKTTYGPAYMFVCLLVVHNPGQKNNKTFTLLSPTHLLWIRNCWTDLPADFQSDWSTFFFCVWRDRERLQEFMESCGASLLCCASKQLLLQQPQEFIPPLSLSLSSVSPSPTAEKNLPQDYGARGKWQSLKLDYTLKL